MSLPGLQLHSIPVAEKSSTVVELSKCTEWRFEVSFDENVDIKLISGTGEIFGTELALNQVYTFNGRKAAIYTWHGCRIEVTGNCQIDYTAEETPMTSYVNAHFALEDLRDNALEDGNLGPRVLIMGPENSGKTTLVKLLAAYATRSGRQPLVVNLDPKEGMLTVPGTLSAIALESILDVEQGWGSSPTNGPCQIPVKLPLVYYYGFEDAEEQGDLYKPLIARLALSAINRMEDDGDVKCSGCIIDTPASISTGKGSYEMVQHIVSEFSVNVVIVIGSERLYSDMSRRFAKKAAGGRDTVSAVKLDKSGGCVDRDREYLRQFRHAQMREYFYGDAKNPLSPHTQLVDFDDLVVYRILEKPAVNHYLLPGGEQGETENDLFEKVEPLALMPGCILAITQAEPNDSRENIRDASVVGFVFVQEVDEKKKKARVLAPLSGRLPRKAMIWGYWPEATEDLIQ